MAAAVSCPYILAQTIHRIRLHRRVQPNSTHTILLTMNTSLLALCLTTLLTACGGGGSDAQTPTPAGPSAADTRLLAYLDTANLSSVGVPWNGQFAGVAKRWSLPIPVKTNGEARAVPAMDAIEARLGAVVFDRTSIANADEAAVTRGIVFRQGTSYLPAGGNPQAYCANVSNAPFSGSWPPGSLRATGELSARLYVNLDNPQCTAGADIVVHELGHALGLGAHFAGFGDGPSISDDFWSVLATLYANPIGAPKASVVVKQINN